MNSERSTSTVSAKLLEPFIQLARHYPPKDDRHITEQILDLVDLTEEEFNKPGARFPEERFPIVLEHLQGLSNNPFVALSLGESAQPQMLGSLGFLMSSAPNLDLAYQILADYLPLIHEGAVIQLEKNTVGLVITLELNTNHLGIISFLLLCFVNWPRHLTGQQVPALQVNFAFPKPNDSRLFQQHFAAEVSFSRSRNQLFIKSEYLNLPCVDANTEMHQLHREYADSLMSKIGVENALTARTRNLIRQHLSGNNGLIRREQVASALGLSLRTLQRKLGQLGSSFQTIYDDTRKEICLQMIQRGEHSFGEISYQLGFSNQSAFQKAFKRWMQTTPSDYREKISPEHVSLNPTQTQTTPTDWLNANDVATCLQQKAEQLSVFGHQLLEWAAIYGDYFTLEQLAELTKHPMARLAIYLWPSEQAGLITKHEGPQGKAHFLFASDLVRDHFLQQQSDIQRSQRHYAVVQLMLRQPQHWQHASQLFYHATKASSELQQQDRDALGLVAQQAAEKSAERGDFHKACDYQQQALVFTGTPSATVPSNKATEGPYWRLVELQILAGDISSAQASIEQHKGASILKALLQARIYQHQGASNKALTHLLEHLLIHQATLALPNTASEQLVFLVERMELHSPKLDGTPLQFPQTNKDATENLAQAHTQQLLEQIALLAREQQQPLLAACAICLMVDKTFTQGVNSHSAFAFASFAWVCSWFGANIKLAKKAAEASRMMLHTTADSATFNYLVARPQDPSLILSCQVEHWFLPLNRVKNHLRELEHSCRMKHQWHELLDILALRYQMIIYHPDTQTLKGLLETLGNTLSTIQHPDLESKKAQVYLSIQQTVNTLTGETVHSNEADTEHVQHLTGLPMCSAIINALILDDRRHWTESFLSVDMLEQDLPGYFCFTDALFGSTMMRAILAQSQGGFSRKGLIEFTRQLSRIEMWASEMPANFACQHWLLKAEKARIDNMDASTFYESAINQCQHNDMGYMAPLCYQRYADYLAEKQQVSLARFCLNHASQLYRRWGAIKAATLVEQRLELQLNLLAK